MLALRQGRSVIVCLLAWALGLFFPSRFVRINDKVPSVIVELHVCGCQCPRYKNIGRLDGHARWQAKQTRAGIARPAGKLGRFFIATSYKT